MDIVFKTFSGKLVPLRINGPGQLVSHFDLMEFQIFVELPEGNANRSTMVSVVNFLMIGTSPIPSNIHYCLSFLPPSVKRVAQAHEL